MNRDLCMGILAAENGLEIAALEPNRPVLIQRFPRTAMGLEAIRGFIADYENGVRLAVAGVAALSVALALGDVPGRETFIVSCSIANQATALARYAEHAL